jgi:DMSO/TMAO reductase YedYZ molybdopterin-dependent catalytic subunit
MFYSLYQQLNVTQTQAPLADPSAEKSELTTLSTLCPALYNNGFLQNPAGWQIEISGLVKKPASFTLEEMRAFTRIQQDRRIVFAEGFTVRANWEGFVAAELLHRVSPLPEAQYLIQYNAASEVECIPLQELYEQRALFCLAAQNNPLSASHGGPLRLLVFNRYAHKGLGQLTRLVLSDTPVSGTFEKQGYDANAWIEPGEYYATDLQMVKTITDSAREVDVW